MSNMAFRALIILTLFGIYAHLFHQLPLERTLVANIGEWWTKIWYGVIVLSAILIDDETHVKIDK